LYRHVALNNLEQHGKSDISPAIFIGPLISPMWSDVARCGPMLSDVVISHTAAPDVQVLDSDTAGRILPVFAQRHKTLCNNSILCTDTCARPVKFPQQWKPRERIAPSKFPGRRL